MKDDPDFHDGGDMFGQWMKRSLHARFGKVLDEDVPDALRRLLDGGHGQDDGPGHDTP